MDNFQISWICTECGYASAKRFPGDICPRCGVTYWMCDGCGFTTPPPLHRPFVRSVARYVIFQI